MILAVPFEPELGHFGAAIVSHRELVLVVYSSSFGLIFLVSYARGAIRVRFGFEAHESFRFAFLWRIVVANFGLPSFVG